MFLPNIQHWLYVNIAKPIFFQIDPEVVHDHTIELGKKLSKSKLAQSIVRKLLAFEDPALSQEILGIKFPNPIGLAAGFDKNAELINILPNVGFGFIEVGSITGEPCQGNPKPRLWRLPKSKGLVVWYGLKNDGSEVIADRLRQHPSIIPIGTSIARTNDATTIETTAGIADYAKAFRSMASIGAYTTINISCPNTCGGETFTSPDRLELLLSELDKVESKKPNFIKLPADLSFDEIDKIVKVCDRHNVQGFIASNLTKQYNRYSINRAEMKGIEKGGISGRPTFDPSNELISKLYKAYGNRYIIIGVGGVFSAVDAYEKIRRGASLVQLITGMIFEGPQLVGAINHDLVKLLKADGFTNISQAIGANH